MRSSDYYGIVRPSNHFRRRGVAIGLTRPLFSTTLRPRVPNPAFAPRLLATLRCPKTGDNVQTHPPVMAPKLHTTGALVELTRAMKRPQWGPGVFDGRLCLNMSGSRLGSLISTLLRGSWSHGTFVPMKRGSSRGRERASLGCTTP